MPIFKERYQDRASAYLLDTVARFGPKLKEVFGLLSRAPVTIVHGDFRLDNMFFGTATGGLPFAVVDWQLIKRGRGVIDVAYFLAWSIEE